MEHDLSQFIAALRQIPLFRGLKPEQARALLKACDRTSISQNEAVCTAGETSDRMFVLLSGSLAVESKEGVRVAQINAVAPVGEMGLFTGEPRSATVLARASATLLVLHKMHLDQLMRRNPDIELIISRNLIRILSERIRNANQEIAHLGRLIADQGAGADTAETES